MIKVLILSGKPETLLLVRSALEELDARYEVCHTVSEMQQKLHRIPFNGLILDVQALVKTSLKEKSFIQELSELYPTLRMRWDSRARRIRGLVFGTPLDKQDPVKDFLEKCCRTWPARIYREGKRLPLHFNVLLSRDQEFREKEHEKTVTLDLSENGCFLITTQVFQKEELAWVRFVELADPTPIPVEIRRYRPWGKGLQIPGIGVEFKEIRPGQLQEIRRYLALR